MGEYEKDVVGGMIVLPGCACAEIGPAAQLTLDDDPARYPEGRTLTGRLTVPAETLDLVAPPPGADRFAIEVELADLSFRPGPSALDVSRRMRQCRRGPRSANEQRRILARRKRHPVRTRRRVIFRDVAIGSDLLRDELTAILGNGSVVSMARSHPSDLAREILPHSLGPGPFDRLRGLSCICWSR